MIVVKYEEDGKFHQYIEGYTKTDHACRKQRVTLIEKSFPIKEIACITMYRGNRNILLKCGILMVFDPKWDELVTAYPAKWRIAQAMWHEVYGEEPPQYMSDAIREIRRWDKKHGYQ